MGFGQWKGKVNWPLDYVRVETEIKVFGIYILDSYRSLKKRNWEHRFGAFRASVISWSSRHLPSLSARIDVLKMFALSRAYYLASILPISKSMVRSFETIIGRFLWAGWLLRVALPEICNIPERGGLKMVCLTSMCKSLLLSQMLRMLKSSYDKSISHLVYW